MNGKRRWVIDRVELNRYELLSSNWNKRLVERVPTLEGRDEQWRQSVKCYPAWGKQNLGDLPQYRLTVSIGDFWRFAYQRVTSEKDYEAIRREIRDRLPGKPRDFAMRFDFDREEVEQILMRIVKNIPPPRLHDEVWNKSQVLSLQYEALEHLKKKALPSLWRAKHGWESYLGKSVKNFYIDKARQSNRSEIPLADLADRDVLSEVAYNDWDEKSHN